MCMKNTGMSPEFSCISVHNILVKYVAFFKMVRIIFVIFPPANKIGDLFPPLLQP
jgi:hypothetical protein